VERLEREQSWTTAGGRVSARGVKNGGSTTRPSRCTTKDTALQTVEESVAWMVELQVYHMGVRSTVANPEPSESAKPRSNSRLLGGHII
jgi:hypothetical protein